MPSRPLPASAKQKILQTLIAKDGSILLRNEQYDCEQIVLDKGEFFYDYFSPRENITYEQRVLTIDQAWEYALQAVPDAIARLVKELPTEDEHGDGPAVH